MIKIKIKIRGHMEPILIMISIIINLYFCCMAHIPLNIKSIIRLNLKQVNI